MQRWEYATHEFRTNFRTIAGTTFDSQAMNQALCELGRQGWELVNVFDITKVKGGTKSVIAVLKRRAPC